MHGMLAMARRLWQTFCTLAWLLCTTARSEGFMHLSAGKHLSKLPTRQHGRTSRLTAPSLGAHLQLSCLKGSCSACSTRVSVVAAAAQMLRVVDRLKVLGTDDSKKVRPNGCSVHSLHSGLAIQCGPGYLLVVASAACVLCDTHQRCCSSTTSEQHLLATCLLVSSELLYSCLCARPTAAELGSTADVQRDCHLCMRLHAARQKPDAQCCAAEGVPAAAPRGQDRAAALPEGPEARTRARTGRSCRGCQVRPFMCHLQQQQQQQQQHHHVGETVQQRLLKDQKLARGPGLEEGAVAVKCAHLLTIAAAATTYEQDGAAAP